MSITCKAAVIRNNKLAEPYKDSKPLSIEDIKISPPLENEVLVKVMGAGLCHSDLSVINGSRVMPLPLVIGHEGSGEVVELGSAVKDIKVGDHVAFQFSPSCGRCRRCLEGRPQVCELAAATKGKGDLMSGGSRLTDMDGNRLNHYFGLRFFLLVSQGLHLPFGRYERLKLSRWQRLHHRLLEALLLVGFPLVLKKMIG